MERSQIPVELLLGGHGEHHTPNIEALKTTVSTCVREHPGKVLVITEDSDTSPEESAYMSRRVDEGVSPLDAYIEYKLIHKIGLPYSPQAVKYMRKMTEPEIHPYALAELKAVESLLKGYPRRVRWMSEATNNATYINASNKEQVALAIVEGVVAGKLDESQAGFKDYMLATVADSKKRDRALVSDLKDKLSDFPDIGSVVIKRGAAHEALFHYLNESGFKVNRQHIDKKKRSYYLDVSTSLHRQDLRSPLEELTDHQWRLAMIAFAAQQAYFSFNISGNRGDIAQEQRLTFGVWLGMQRLKEPQRYAAFEAKVAQTSFIEAFEAIFD